MKHLEHRSLLEVHSTRHYKSKVKTIRWSTPIQKRCHHLSNRTTTSRWNTSYQSTLFLMNEETLTVTGVEPNWDGYLNLSGSVIEYKSQVQLTRLQMNHTETMVRYSSGDLTDLTTSQYNKSQGTQTRCWCRWTEQVV